MSDSFLHGLTTKPVPHLVRVSRLALGLVLVASSPWGLASPSVYPTGVTRYDPHAAHNSYVLFTGADRRTHLIDMNGHEVRQWPQEAQPPVLLDPALAGGAKGRVLLQLSAPGGATPQAIGELDWDGRVVWQWQGGKSQEGYAAGGVSTDASGREADVRQHHDWRRLPNGRTALLVNVVRTAPSGFVARNVLDDGIYEVDAQGEVVWRWLASDHLDELGFSETSLKLIKGGLTRNDPALPFDFLHLNNMSVLGPNKWFDAGDQRFHPDNYLVCSREANLSFVISRASGKVVWRLGPDYPRPAEWAATLPRPVDQIVGQHDAHIIPKGLPGAGNLLVFDNQGEAGYPRVGVGTQPRSRVLEIDPVRQQIVWQYTAVQSGQPGWAFYSSFISSARRLPNGNTLINEGMNGRFFQVTPSGSIVWEYVSPYQGQTRSGGEGQLVWGNSVYRAQPVPYDWVPPNTPHTEVPVAVPTLSQFQVVRVPWPAPLAPGAVIDAPVDRKAVVGDVAELEIPFANAGGVRNWLALSDTVLLVEDRHGQWFEATLQVPSQALTQVEEIGFDTSPSGAFGRHSAIVVKGLRYPVVSFKRSPSPAQRVDLRRR